MVARADPADPTRYIGVFGDDLSDAVTMYRDGLRLRPTVPHLLQRADELETGPDVIAVIRFPVGDVYIDTATRVRIGSLDVLFGKVFARVRGFFSVENQNVVAGVEGTEFAFEATGDGTTQIIVLDGTVLSSSKNLPWKPLRVTPGQAFTVTDSGGSCKSGRRRRPSLRSCGRGSNAWTMRSQFLRRARLKLNRSRNPNRNLTATSTAAATATSTATFQPQPQLDPALAAASRTRLPPVIVLPISPIAPVQSGYCCDRREGSSDRRWMDAGAGFTIRRPRRTGDARPRGWVTAVRTVGSSKAPLPSVVAPSPSIRERVREAVPRLRRNRHPAIAVPEDEVTPTTRNQCRGSFFTDETTARRMCAAPPPMGYCCAGGEVSRVNRTQCRGKYFAEEASARKACAPPPEQGYCCAGGKVSQDTRDRCDGTFSRSQAEALRACGVRQMQPKPDSVLKSQIIKKAPDEPVVK